MTRLAALLVLLAAVAIVARTKAPTEVRAVRSPATPDEDSGFVPMAAWQPPYRVDWDWGRATVTNRLRLQIPDDAFADMPYWRN